MRQPGRDKDGGAGRSVYLTMLKSKAEEPVQNVPGFIVGVVNVEIGWPGVGPLADHQGVSSG
jgi:hypothetical protein